MILSRRSWDIRAVNEWYLCLVQGNRKSNTPQVCSTNGEDNGQLPRAASRELRYRVPFWSLLSVQLEIEYDRTCSLSLRERPSTEGPSRTRKSFEVLRISTGRGSFLFVNSAPVSIGASDTSQSLCPHQCGDPQILTAHQDITQALVMDQQRLILHGQVSVTRKYKTNVW